MSPLRVLTRGYSIVSDEQDRLVRSVKTIGKGAHLRLRFPDGSAKCRVEEIEEEQA